MCRKLIVNNLIKLGNRDICWEGLSLPKGEIWEMTAKQLINCIKQGKDEVYGLALDGEDNLVFDESFYTVNLMTKTHVNSFVPLKEQDCLVNCFYTVIGTHKEKNVFMYDVVSSKYERTSFDETMVKTLIQMGVINSGCTIQNDKILVAPLEKTKPVAKKEQEVYQSIYTGTKIPIVIVQSVFFCLFTCDIIIVVIIKEIKTIMFDVFSTREVAGAFYISLFMVYILSRKETRQAVIKVIKCACKIKLVIPFLILLGYTGGIIYFSTYLSFWNNIYIKDIVMWFLFVGVPYCYNAVSEGENENYFTKLFKENLKFIVLLEFFVGTFTFGIVTELILQPILTFIVLMQTMAGTKKEWIKTRKLLDSVMALIGIVIVIFTVKAAMGSYAEINPIDTVVSFCIPVIFSVLFIPCAYLLAVIAKYETVYIRMGFKEPKDKKIRRKRHLKLFLICRLSYKKLCMFHNDYIKQMYVLMKEEEYIELIEDFKRHNIGGYSMEKMCRVLKRYWLLCMLLCVVIIIVAPFITEWIIREGFYRPDTFDEPTWFSFMGSYLGAIITVIIFFFTICINQISVQDEISRNRKNAEIEREIEKAKKIYNFFTLGAYRLQDLDVELAEFRRLLEDLIIIRTYVEQLTIESKPANDVEKAKKDFYDCVVTENFLLHVNVVGEMQALGDNKRKEQVSKLILEIVKHRNLYIEEMTRRYEKYIEALIKQIG